MADKARADIRLEDLSIEIRLLYEEAYQRDPVRTRNTLIAVGYWQAAAQLKIDHAMGRLAEP